MDNAFNVALKRKLSEAAKLTTLVGQFVGIESGQAFVDVGGGRIPAWVVGPLPEVAADVHVWFVNGKPFIMGPTALQPSTGTITAIGTLTVTVATDAGSFDLPFLSWYGPVVGDTVKIAWGDLPMVLGVGSKIVPPPAAPAAPTSDSSGTKVQTFTAVDSGSWQAGNGWWTDQVWASDINTGAAFYGSKIHDTLHDRTVDKFEVWLDPIQISGSNPNFVTHSSQSKPSGNVSVANTTAQAPKAGWNTFPKVMGQYLVDHVGGFGVNHGGYNKFQSVNANGDSFKLRFTTH